MGKNYAIDIFNILGIQPNEIFLFKDEDGDKYEAIIEETLDLRTRYYDPKSYEEFPLEHKYEGAFFLDNRYSIVDFLNGLLEIIKKDFSVNLFSSKKPKIGEKYFYMNFNLVRNKNKTVCFKNINSWPDVYNLDIDFNIHEATWENSVTDNYLFDIANCFSENYYIPVDDFKVLYKKFLYEF